MYRIKTDIRQFKCDSQEKVEKLIQNWVIRPTDLIYQNKTWEPIGSHPIFLPVFERMRDDAEGESEAWVTSQQAGLSIKNSEASEVSVSELEESELGSEKSVLKDEVQEDKACDAGLVEKVEEVESRREKLPGAMLIKPPKRLKPRSDEATKEPELPEGALVEQEQLLTRSAPAGVNLFVERKEKKDNVFDHEDHGIDDDPDLSDGVMDHPLEEHPEPLISRADLPEELFVTAEIQSQAEYSSQGQILDELAVARRDELEDLSGFGAQASSSVDEEWDTLAVASPESAPPRHPETEEMDPVVREALLEDMRSVDVPGDHVVVEHEGGSDVVLQKDKSKVHSTEAITVDLNLDKEAESHEIAFEDTADFEIGSLQKLTSGTLLDEERSSEAASDVIASTTKDDVEVTGPTLEGEQDVEGLEGLVEVHVLPVDDEPEPVQQNVDLISEGYGLSFPFKIEPSPNALFLGVQRTKASRSEKERAFPYPKPKKRDVVISLRYGYGDRIRDKSKMIVLFGLLLFCFIVLILVQWMSH